MSRSIIERTVWSVALALITLSFVTIAPTDSQSAICSVPIGTARDTGTIYAFHAAGDGTLLIGTQTGLLHRDGDKLVPFGPPYTGSITLFQTTSDGTVLIGAAEGLFRRDGDKLVPIGKIQDHCPN